MAGKIVHNDNVARLEGWGQNLIDIGLSNQSPLIGPSSTMVATIPVIRKPATKIVVLRCP